MAIFPSASVSANSPPPGPGTLNSGLPRVHLISRALTQSFSKSQFPIKFMYRGSGHAIISSPGWEEPGNPGLGTKQAEAWSKGPWVWQDAELAGSHAGFELGPENGGEPLEGLTRVSVSLALLTPPSGRHRGPRAEHWATGRGRIQLQASSTPTSGNPDAAGCCVSMESRGWDTRKAEARWDQVPGLPPT